jgi:hypothetical protein
MKKLFWGIAMAAVIAVGVLIAWATDPVSWTLGAEGKPAAVKVNTEKSRQWSAEYATRLKKP